MGMMSVLKWFKKDEIPQDYHRNEANFEGEANEANILDGDGYRAMLREFINRRKNLHQRKCIVASSSSLHHLNDSQIEFFYHKNNENNNKKMSLGGVPHVDPIEISEDSLVAGTENNYLFFVHAEWKKINVTLRRNTHPSCKDAIKTDLKVLSDIRHSNILLLMGTTRGDDESDLMTIFEPIDCNLANFIQLQSGQMTIVDIVKCAGGLAEALKFAHMRGYIHSCINPYNVLLASTGIVKLGGWEFAINLNEINIKGDYEALLRSEVSKWLAPEIYNSQEVSTATDVYGLSLIILEMCTLGKYNSPSAVSTTTTNINYDEKYTKWKCGIITNMSNFPPLLTSLVEAGLQLDVTTRTINIPRIRKYLQRLEVQYEDQRPIHISTLIKNYNNNNNNDDNNNIKNNIDSSISNCSSFARRFKMRNKTLEKTLKPYSASTSITSIPQTTSFDNNQTSTTSPLTSLSSIPIRRYSEDYLSTHLSNTFDGNKVISLDSLASENHYETIQDNDNLMQQNTPTSHDKARVSKKLFIDADKADGIQQDTDARLDIKKIKESLAEKRKKFFCNNYNSLNNQSIDGNGTGYSVAEIISPTNKFSDSTSFLSKNKSLNDDDNELAYLSAPAVVKDAVVPPGGDEQDFYKKSAWRKERLICMSKMSESESVFGINSSNDIDISLSSSSASDKTFPVIASPEKNDFKKSDDWLGEESTRRIMTKSTSLQTFHKIKNALDRAREILTTNSCEINLKNDSIEKGLDNVVEEEVGKTERLNNSGDTYTIGSPEPKIKKIVVDEGENNHCSCSVENKNKYNVQVQAGENEKQINKSMKDEKSGKNFAFFVFDDDDEEKKEKCLSCSQTSLPRRSSLPARLGSIKCANYPINSKLPTELTSELDNAFQDIYIDDEFDENLAANMLLLDHDHSFDDKELDDIFNTDVIL